MLVLLTILKRQNNFIEPSKCSKEMQFDQLGSSPSLKGSLQCISAAFFQIAAIIQRVLDHVDFNVLYLHQQEPGLSSRCTEEVKIKFLLWRGKAPIVLQVAKYCAHIFSVRERLFNPQF